MREFFKKYRSFALFTVICVGFALACTDVDESLGSGFVPDGQQMEVRTARVGNVETYITYSDSSLYSNFRGQMLIGSMIDPVFGQTRCGSIIQFYPFENDFNDGDLYGYNPVADSIKLTMYLRSAYGKEDVEQTFNFYPLIDSLPTDTAYYHSFPVEKVVDFSKPLFSFKMKDETLTTVKLLDIIGQDGRDYLQSMVDVDPKILADPYEKYRELFHGLYVTAAPDSPEDAAVYKIDLLNSEGTNYTLFTVFAHNYDRDAQTPTIKDSVVYTQYIFDDKPIKNVLLWPNMGVTHIEHNYPDEIAARINDTLAGTPSNDIVYVQGLFGLRSMLRFTDDFVDQIKGLLAQAGNDFKAITFNQALMYLYLVDDSTDAMNDAPARLGLYTDFTGRQPAYAPDYNYVYEDEGVTIPYDGYLDRSNGRYVLNISSYISYLVNNPDAVPPTLYLWPGAYTIAEQYSAVALYGTGGAKPLEIALTYTLVK